MPKIVATKEDWILLGYKLFAEQGISAIVVEKMASKLKVNKSSFYWHFKTKKDFINAIISHWTSTDTLNIIEEVESKKTSMDKFVKLIEIAFRKEPLLDFVFFLKRYGLKDKKVQKLINDINNQRIDYTAGLLMDLGYTKADAIMKANLLYKYLIGYHEMIRYKKQSKNYLSEVINELNQFIKF